MSEKWDAMPIALKLAENGCVIGSRIVKVIEDLEHAYAAGVASVQNGKMVKMWGIVNKNDGELSRVLHFTKRSACEEIACSYSYERVVPVKVILEEDK